MPKAPMTRRPRELSEGGTAGLRRVQFIEPIASPKTLVVVSENRLSSRTPGEHSWRAFLAFSTRQLLRVVDVKKPTSRNGLSLVFQSFLLTCLSSVTWPFSLLGVDHGNSICLAGVGQIAESDPEQPSRSTTLAAGFGIALSPTTASLDGSARPPQSASRISERFLSYSSFEIKPLSSNTFNSVSR